MPANEGGYDSQDEDDRTQEPFDGDDGFSQQWFVTPETPPDMVATVCDPGEKLRLELRLVSYLDRSIQGTLDASLMNPPWETDRRCGSWAVRSLPCDKASLRYADARGALVKT